MLRINRRNFIKTLGLGTVSAFVPGCFNIAENDKHKDCCAVSSILNRRHTDFQFETLNIDNYKSIEINHL